MDSEAQEKLMLRRVRQRILNDENLPESIIVANDGHKGVVSSHDVPNGGAWSVVGVKIGPSVYNLFFNALDDAYSLLRQLGKSPGGRDLKLRALVGTEPYLVHATVQTGIDETLPPSLEIYDTNDPDFQVSDL